MALSVACAMEASWQAAFLYERAAVDSGQWWRLLTGGFAHVSPNHLLLNAAALALLAYVTPRPARARLLAWLVPWSAAVMLAEHVVGVHAWAGGLSGALHAYAICLAACGGRGPRLIALSTVAKLWWEATHGPSADSAQFIGAQVLTSQHLYGACIGLAGLVLVWAMLPGRQAVSINGKPIHCHASAP